MLQSSLLLLPGDEEFDFILQNTPPPGSGRVYVTDLSGMIRSVDDEELEEYLEGGEYQERLDQIGDSNALDALWTDSDSTEY
jgi:hypothetical protein